MFFLLLEQFWCSSEWPGPWLQQPDLVDKEKQDNGKPAFSLLCSFPSLPDQPDGLSFYICPWLLHGTQSVATEQTTGPETEKVEVNEEWEAPHLFSRRVVTFFSSGWFLGTSAKSDQAAAVAESSARLLCPLMEIISFWKSVLLNM
nr:uncharacterized protein LOC105480688 [Macaca nemestrina]